MFICGGLYSIEGLLPLHMFTFSIHIFTLTYPRFIWNIKKMCIISINRYKSSYLLNINLHRHQSHKNIRFSSKVISSLSTLYMRRGEKRRMGGKKWIRYGWKNDIFVDMKDKCGKDGFTIQWLQSAYRYFYIKFLLLPLAPTTE